MDPDPPWLESVSLYLINRNKSKINLHSAVCEGRKVQYFRGKRAITALLDDSFKKDFPEQPIITTRPEAKHVMQQLVNKGFLFAAEKPKPKVLLPAASKEFSEERYYVWLYEDPAAQKWAIVKGAALVALVVLILLFPTWPQELKLGAWYLSAGALSLIGVMIAVLLVRIPVFYISRLIVPPGVWIFPNINEDVSFLESFWPVWDYDQPSREKRSLRRRRGRDDHSGSSHQEDNEEEEGTEPLGDSSAPSSSANSSAPTSAATGENYVGELRKRFKGRTEELRVDSENDGDNEGAENDPDPDLDVDFSPPAKPRTKFQ